MITPELLKRMDAYWRAANYLSVGQLYLRDNPLLREPLKKEHVKSMLLGHWGTTPGQNFIYVHLNRVIKKFDLDMIYISGPGHGGPALVGNTYLEGTYSEIYPEITQDEAGLKKLFKQFSFPGGIPSHVSPECPGSIHEGGELGYSLSHAFGAAFDNPELIVACVVGDGEAETGPLATAWHSNKFLNPITDGAVLPILHLNGYKIANPAVLARIEPEELDQLLRGYGWTPYFVEGDDPETMHQLMAEVLEKAITEIRQIQSNARKNNAPDRPRWPMIVLRSPKGWTGPKEVDGIPNEGTSRSHQIPILVDADHPGHLKLLENWMKSYKPEELFDKSGRLLSELAELAPKGERRMGANPHANGGLLLQDLILPDFTNYAVSVPSPGSVQAADIFRKETEDQSGHKMIQILAAIRRIPIRIFLQQFDVKPVQAARSFDVERVIPDWFNGGDAGQREEKTEVIVEVRVGASDRFALHDVFRFETNAVGRKNELGLLRRSLRAFPQSSQRGGDFAFRADFDVDVSPLENTAGNIRLIRVSAPQALEGGLFVSKGLKKSKREVLRIKRSLSESGNGFFDFDSVHFGSR